MKKIKRSVQSRELENKALHASSIMIDRNININGITGQTLKEKIEISRLKKDLMEQKKREFLEAKHDYYTAKESLHKDFYTAKNYLEYNFKSPEDQSILSIVQINHHSKPKTTSDSTEIQS